MEFSFSFSGKGGVNGSSGRAGCNKFSISGRNLVFGSLDLIGNRKNTCEALLPVYHQPHPQEINFDTHCHEK
jgi:hypothetical protein